MNCSSRNDKLSSADIIIHAHTHVYPRREYAIKSKQISLTQKSFYFCRYHVYLTNNHLEKEREQDMLVQQIGTVQSGEDVTVLTLVNPIAYKN